MAPLPTPSPSRPPAPRTGRSLTNLLLAGIFAAVATPYVLVWVGHVAAEQRRIDAPTRCAPYKQSADRLIALMKGERDAARMYQLQLDARRVMQDWELCNKGSDHETRNLDRQHLRLVSRRRPPGWAGRSSPRVACSILLPGATSMVGTHHPDVCRGAERSRQAVVLWR